MAWTDRDHEAPAAQVDRGDRVCVIGAGPSGISAGKHLRRVGLAFDILETNGDFGGLWDWRAPGSAAYSSTHLISSKATTEYPDFPMPRSYPDYPSVDQVLTYIRAYAEHCGVREHTEFSTRVVRVDRLASDGGWKVAVDTPRGQESRLYRALVVCNGHMGKPHWPQFPGTFDGELIHSICYSTADAFTDKRVLVVGAGNTGCDIAVEASRVARAAYLSMRRGYHYVPKYLFGKPADQLLPLPVSLRLRRPLDRLLIRLAIGDTRRLGLPAPTHKLYECIPIVNSELLYALGHGRVLLRPDVRKLDGPAVEFIDGSRLELDTVVYATGYEPSFDFLPPDLIEWDDHKPRLFMNQFHPRLDDIAIIGLTEVLAGGWPIEDIQCDLAARFLVSSIDGHTAAARAFRRIKAGPEPALSRGLHLQPPLHYDHVAYLRYMRRLCDLFDRDPQLERAG